MRGHLGTSHNRTSVELKPDDAADLPEVQVGHNRTSVELKFCEDRRNYGGARRHNRTSVELKCRYVTSYPVFFTVSHNRTSVELKRREEEHLPTRGRS